MTTETLQQLIVAYMKASEHRLWVARNLEHFKLETPDGAMAALQAAEDQERACLTAVVEAAREMILVSVV
jgi:hypothetical protein